MSAAVGRMNLLELRDKYRDLFYSQAWFLGEAFMRQLPTDGAPLTPPSRILRMGTVVPKKGTTLPYAVDVAHAFVKNPKHPNWENWLWCADFDKHGQRIFVGAKDGRFEIHRHLAITERWGIPLWR